MLLAAFSYFVFTCFDTITKYLAARFSVFQIMTCEFFVAALVVFVFVCFKKGHAWRDELKPRMWKLHALRGVLQIMSQSLFFIGFVHIPLTEFYVILFTIPLLVMLFSGWLLGEKITAALMVAMALGFLGVCVALRPDQGLDGWTLLIFLGALLNAAAATTLRRMMKTEKVMATAFSLCLVLASGMLIPGILFFKMPGIDDFLLMVLGGVFYGAATCMFSAAFSQAPASRAVVPQFLQLIYGAIAGYLVFNHVPTVWIYIGGAIVIASNLYLVWMQEKKPNDPMV
jgi:drug/metabolite transporter (DMT)-like permease